MCGGCVVDDVRVVVVFSCLGGNGSHGGAKFVRSGVRGACGAGGYPAMLLWVLLWAHIAARCWAFLFFLASRCCVCALLDGRVAMMWCGVLGMALCVNGRHMDIETCAGTLQFDTLGSMRFGSFLCRM